MIPTLVRPWRLPLGDRLLRASLSYIYSLVLRTLVADVIVITRYTSPPCYAEGGVFHDMISTGFGIDGAMIVGVLTFFKHSVPLVAIALAVGVSGGIGVIFGVVPARRAA